VRRGHDAGARRSDESVDEWLARVHEGRSSRDLLGWSPDDDVADPIGLSTTFYAEIADEIETFVGELVALAWAPELQMTEGRR